MTAIPEQHDAARGARPRDSFRPDIQGLRAVAVLLVALDHAGVGLVHGGYIGVDVFFVISGFLITGWLLRRALADGRVPFGAFYAARARRILPAASLTLVATVVACWYALNAVRALAAFHDALWAAVFAANIHFAQVGTDYFARDNPPSPLQHFWTLAVEEQFYVVWPAALALAIVLVGGRRRGVAERFLRRRLAVVVAAVVAASLAWSVVETAASPTAAYFSALARGWELGAGALLAVCLPGITRLPRRTRVRMTWIGLGGILFGAVVFSSSTPFPGYAALLPVVSTVLVIAGGAGGEPEGAVRVLGLRPMRLTGDISYAFYLWHWPFLIIVAEHAGRTLSVGENLLLLAAAYATSLVSYALVEQPVRHSLRLSRPAPALGLWPVTAGAVGVVAGLAIASAPAPASTRPLRIVPEPLAVYARAVAQSVTAQRQSQPVPSTLTPAVVDLLHDGPQGCVRRGGLGAHCTLGAVRAKRVIVALGDSHAAAWMPAIDYFARTHHLRLVPVVKASCTMGVATTPGDCGDWFAQALARIRGLHPVAVVVGQYFDPRIPRSQMLAGVTAEMDALSRAAPDVILMEDPPGHDLNPVDCLLAGGATLGSCTFTLTPDQQGVYAAVERLATAAGATYVHTLKWFCAGTRCPLVVGHLIVYWDTNHMTTTYARWLGVPVGASLAPLVLRGT
jgi:peptidoglycan/LPS O-acetylase OafA/YrhL